MSDACMECATCKARLAGFDRAAYRAAVVALARLSGSPTILEQAKRAPFGASLQSVLVTAVASCGITMLGPREATAGILAQALAALDSADEAVVEAVWQRASEISAQANSIDLDAERAGFSGGPANDNGRPS